MVHPARRLALPGGEVSYFRAGDGRPTVFLHAGGGGGEWTPFHARLGEGRDLIAPDHPGFGRSSAFPALSSIDDLVYHYLDVFDDLGLESFDLVGCSFGGWIAAELAVHSPHLIRRLVLMAPAGLRVPGSPPADLFVMGGPEVIETLFHDPAVIEAILSSEPSIDAAVKSYHDMATLSRFSWKPFLCNPRLEGRLHRINAPTRIIEAEFDRVVPRAHTARYAESIHDAELITIPGVGHALYGENLDPVVRSVLDHLDSTEQRG